MLKLVKLFILIFFMSLTSFYSSAGLIKPKSEDITSNYYISLGGYDWVWASAINVQFFSCDPKKEDSSISYDTYNSVVYDNRTNSGCSDPIAHQLLAPTFHNGWTFYEDLFSNNLTIEEYLQNISNKQYSKAIQLFFNNSIAIEAFEFWNTNININDKNYSKQNPLASKWLSKNRNRAAVSPFADQSIYANTIYVRPSQTQPVPEPATILIFAIALLALSVRSRKQA